VIFHVKAPFRIELFQAGHAKTLVRIYVDKKMFGVFLFNRYMYFLLHACTKASLLDYFTKGNCAVIKPSEVASSTAEILTELFPKYLDQVMYLFFTMKLLLIYVCGIIYANVVMQ